MRMGRCFKASSLFIGQRLHTSSGTPGSQPSSPHGKSLQDSGRGFKDKEEAGAQFGGKAFL